MLIHLSLHSITSVQFLATSITHATIGAVKPILLWTRCESATDWGPMCDRMDNGIPWDRMGPRLEDEEDSNSEDNMLLEASGHNQYTFASLHHYHSLF